MKKKAVNIIVSVLLLTGAPSWAAEKTDQEKSYKKSWLVLSAVCAGLTATSFDAARHDYNNADAIGQGRSVHASGFVGSVSIGDIVEKKKRSARQNSLVGTILAATCVGCFVRGLSVRVDNRQAKVSKEWKF